ncbi:hypothetical protein [Streptomyces sp. H39-S7]|uniref:hypothetical protein n=1 Tax=Streptomyces sp. H39-S7 TaxID=3004357 RepID=UPI0022AEEDCE|nr:hypothetical protein [Streptomyces sp. H39-S7]MCZ4125139.1 hypothetical protein [Streptomyces sp. H39-S7]
MVLAAGTALVGAMATDAWQQAREGTVAWWRRVSGDQADAVGSDLAAARPQVLAARVAGDRDVERALIGAWQLRLQQLVAAGVIRPADLRSLLDEQLTPVLPPEEASAVGSLVQRATASGDARIYQAGRDLHINDQ